jgi:hypothetical protein
MFPKMPFRFPVPPGERRKRFLGNALLVSHSNPSVSGEGVLWAETESFFLLPRSGKLQTIGLVQIIPTLFSWSF